MRIVYVLTHGAYSDYGVICIFENREDADEHCAALNGGKRVIDDYAIDGYTVEEFQFYESGERPHRITLWEAKVSIDRQGNAANPLVTKRIVGEGHDNPIPTNDFFEVKDYEWYGSNIDVRVSTTRGEDVALKALWDRVAVVQARLAGIG